MEEGWSRVTPAGKHAKGGRRLMTWVSAVLLVPAVIILLQSRPEASHASVQANLAMEEKLAAFDAAASRRPHVVKAAADTGMIQHISAKSKMALMHNVKTMLKEKNQQDYPVNEPLSSEKIQLRMFMESKCPGCRHFSTTYLKELMGTPGFTDIVSFQAVPWGWGTVVEAPTAAQIKNNETKGNKVNSTVALLSLLQGLGSLEQQTPPFSMVCQHGWEECQGNAMEACVQDVEPDTTKFFPVFDCIESRSCAEGMKPPMCVGPPVEVAGSCFEEFGAKLHLNVPAIIQCYNSPRAQELMLINDMQTLEAKPQWVPWFTVDGKPLISEDEIVKNDTEAFKAQMLMGSKICDMYVAKTGNKPPACCATFPKTLDQLPTPQEMAEKFPPTNFTTLIAQLEVKEKEEEEQRKLAAQKEQAGLAWQMQAARNMVMRKQEQAQTMHEREMQEQQRSEEENAAKTGSTEKTKSWTSWLNAVFQKI